MTRIDNKHVAFVILTVAFASSLSLLGGIGLEIVEDKLLPLVPLLIALPAINTSAADYAAIIAAHASDPADNTRIRRKLTRAVAGNLSINIIGILVLSILVAWQRDYVFSSGFLVKFAVFLVASLSSVVMVVMFATRLLERFMKRRNLDPNDTLLPIATSLSGIMMLSLIAAAAWFLF